MEKLQWFRITRSLFSNWLDIYWGKLINRSPQILRLRNKIEIEALHPNTIIPIVAEIWHDKVYGGVIKRHKICASGDY